METTAEGDLRQQVRELGEWFHNLDLGGVCTAPSHFLGDYPRNKWERLRPFLPARLDGASVLDIGCNAGFYSFAFKRLGAGRVIGIDVDERYLRQASFAAEFYGLEVEFRHMSAYEAARLGERFDYVLFMGLFYHLRYPLYALDLITQCVGGRLIFQTMVRGASAVPTYPDYDFWDPHPFRSPGFPCMYFIEKNFAGDPTNWWIPNPAAVAGMLASAGLQVEAQPESETWICTPRRDFRRGRDAIWARELEGSL